MVVDRAGRLHDLAVAEDLEWRRVGRDGGHLVGMDRRACGMIDGDEPGLVEVNDLLERLDDLEDVIAVSRGQLGQDDVLGGVGPSERGGTRPVSQPSHAAEVRHERELPAVPGEEVRARGRAGGRFPESRRPGCRPSPARPGAASRATGCGASPRCDDWPSPAWTRSGGIAVAPAGVPTTYCWVTLPDAELDPGADGRARRPAGLVLRALALKVKRQPVAPLGRVHEEHRRRVHRGMREVGLAVAVEIGGHADGVAGAAPARQQVPGIGRRGVRRIACWASR